MRYKLIKCSLPGWEEIYNSKEETKENLVKNICSCCERENSITQDSSIDEMLATPCGCEFEVEKLYTVRKDVFNLTIDEWSKFNQLADAYGKLEISCFSFLNEIGLPDGSSSKFNEEERMFFDEIYELERYLRD